MYTFRIIALVFIAGLLLYIDGIVITRLFKTKNNLKSVSGFVTTQAKEHFDSGRDSYNAVVLGIYGEKMQFAVQDNKTRAYNYLINNNVKQATIYYDQNAYNADDNLTYHIYSVIADDKEILTTDEAKHNDKIGLLIIIPVEILIGTLIYIKNFKQKDA